MAADGDITGRLFYAYRSLTLRRSWGTTLWHKPIGPPLGRLPSAGDVACFVRRASYGFSLKTYLAPHRFSVFPSVRRITRHAVLSAKYMYEIKTGQSDVVSIGGIVVFGRSRPSPTHCLVCRVLSPKERISMGDAKRVHNAAQVLLAISFGAFWQR